MYYRGISTLVSIALSGGASPDACEILEQTLIAFVAAVRREAIAACCSKLEEDQGWDALDYGHMRLYADEMQLMAKWLREQMEQK